MIAKLKGRLNALKEVVAKVIWEVRNFVNTIKSKLHLNLNLPNWLKAILYLSPALILLALFTFYPIINAFRLVIYEGYQHVVGPDGNLVESVTGFTIFGNFASVISQDNFLFPSSHTNSSVILNTLFIVLLSVPLSIVLSLMISVLLNSIKPLKSFFQTVFFLPYITNTLAIGLVFAYMFQASDAGLVNKLLSFFGIEAQSWIETGAEYWQALLVLIVFSVWDGMAFKIMVFISGIQGIDKQYYQAAAIDATPRKRILTKITIPMISPMIYYIVVTSVIGAFKTYSSVVAILGDTAQPSGANYNLKTIVFHIYDYIYSGEDWSKAAAASIILFLIILVLTLIQMRVGKKRVHY